MTNYSLNQINIFITVSECLNFTQAAKKLHLSKASVSQAISQLENSFKVPLFKRTTRKISLTEEGEVFYQQAKRIGEEIIITNQLISGFKAKPEGILKISANPYFAETKLMPILKAYQKQYPQVSIELLTEERMPDMFQENTDIVLGVNWPAPDDIVRKKIDTTRYILCASPNYLKQYGTPKSIKDLNNHFYIPHLNRRKEDLITSFKKPITLPKPKIKLKANNAHFMKKFALNAMGIVQLHDYIVKEKLKSGELISILDGYFKDEIPLYVYFQKHRYVQPKIRCFIDLLTQDIK